MPRSKSLLIILLIIAACLVTWWLVMRPSEFERATNHEERIDVENPINPSAFPKPSDEGLMEDSLDNITPQQKRFLDAFNTPISFWGRVEDLSGRPIPGADVTIHVNDQPWDLEGRSDDGRRLKSDSNGRFEIKGLQGSSIAVKVKKEGYAQVGEKQLGTPSSSRRITYANPKGLLHNQIPTPAEPAIFVLRKRLEADILDVAMRERYNLPTNGEPLRIGLGGKTVVDVRCWASPEDRRREGRNAPFDWRFEVSVEGGGGLREWDDPGEVVAPNSGYRDTFRLEMPATLPEEDWRSSRRDLAFWVKLSDGTYARLKLDVRVGRTNQLYVTSWRNPTGSTNLEHDPTKENRL